MERQIKLENIVSSIDFYDHNSMNKIVNLVIEIESDYYFIEDEFDKIIDITQMPTYIKEDWFKYNRKSLTLSVINKHVKYLKDSIEKIYETTISIYQKSEEEQKLQDVLERVLSIRRDFIIKGII